MPSTVWISSPLQKKYAQFQIVPFRTIPAIWRQSLVHGQSERLVTMTGCAHSLQGDEREDFCVGKRVDRMTDYALHAPVQEMQLELHATVFDTLLPCHKANMKASAKREQSRESCVKYPGEPRAARPAFVYYLCTPWWQQPRFVPFHGYRGALAKPWPIQLECPFGNK